MSNPIENSVEPPIDDVEGHGLVDPGTIDSIEQHTIGEENAG